MPSTYFSDTRYRMDYTVSLVRQEIENNRSLIRRTLAIVRVGSGYAWSNTPQPWAVSGPVPVSGSFTFDFNNYSSLTLLRRDDWVTHEDDGTKVVPSGATVHLDLPGGVSARTIGPFNTTLPTIPRATTPSVSGSFVTGSEKTINLPRATSSFTHEVTYKVGSTTGTIATAAGSSVDWTPPHSLASNVPNGTSTSVTITVVTKSGSTTIGTKSASYTLNISSAVIPSIPSNITWTDQNSRVDTNIGAFVQGLSRMKASIPGSGIYGSSITKKETILGSTTYPETTTFVPSSSGTINATGRVTDSRGRTGTRSTSFTVLPYQPPRLGANGWMVRRGNSSAPSTDNSGTYLYLDLHAIGQSLVVGTQKNALKISIRYKPSNSGWSTAQVVNPGLTQSGRIALSRPSGGFLETLSYDIEVIVTDNAAPLSPPPLKLTTKVSTVSVAIDIKGSKVGIGKMHELGTLDVGGTIYQNGNQVVDTTMAARFLNYISSSGRVQVGTGDNAGGTGATFWNLSPAGDTSTTWAAWLTHNGETRFVIPKSGAISQTYLPRASQSEWGVTAAATQANVNAGTDNSDKYVTPATLRNSSNIPYFISAGGVTVGNGATVTVTYPSNKFSVSPVIQLQMEGSTNSGNVGYARLVERSSTNFKVQVWTIGGAHNGGYVLWQAIQMQASAASG